MAADVTRSVCAVQRLLGLFILAAWICGCGDRRAEFIAGRVHDTCDGTWPVCDSFAGCLIGDRSYITGRFPNKGRFIVRIAEPSKVRVHVFLEDVGAAGEQTTFTLYEDRCRSRTRVEATGRTFVAEAERAGAFVREADLAGEGDHLVEFESDAQARYVIKVDVRPARLLEDNGL